MKRSSSGFLGATTQPLRRNQKNKNQLMKKMIPAALALSASLLLTGCASEAIKAGDIISITQRTFGIKVGQAPANGSPEVTLGLIATTVQFTPTSTNGPVFAPNYANTFKIGQSAVPFSFDVDETIASGNIQTGAGSNTTSIAIIPGLSH
ncbi:MAG: hypothetical protein JWR19_2926 [Pedosphaera sp.]|nr:hypothetical protein [Pedosphaera sp.]